MLARADGEEDLICLPGANNIFTTRSLKSVEEVICQDACPGCSFYSPNPGCKIINLFSAIGEIKIILATYGYNFMNEVIFL